MSIPAAVHARPLVHRLLSSGAWTVAGRATAAAAGFAANAMLARCLSPAELGAFFFAQSVIAAGVMFAHVGMPSVAVRRVSEALATGGQPSAASLARATSAVVLGAACAVGLVVAAALSFTADHALGSQALGRAAWVVGLSVVVVALMTHIAEIFRALDDFATSALLASSAHTALLCAVVAWFAWAGAPLTLGTTLVASLLAATAATAPGLARLVRRLPRRSRDPRAAIRPLLAIGLPLQVSAIAIFVATQADLWLVAFLLGPDAVASYGAAARLLQFGMFPMLVMNAVLAPLVAQLRASGDRTKLERLVRGSAALTAMPVVAFLAVVTLAAEPLLGLAYGNFFRNAGPVLFVLALGQTLNILAGPAAIVLMMGGEQRAAMVISVACALVVIAGGWIGATAAGTTGIAMAAAAGTAMHGWLCWHRARGALGVTTHLSLSDLGPASRALLRRVPR